MSHIKTIHVPFTTSYHVSHYPVYPEITKITSSIDAKTEPHEGRNKGYKVVLGECLRLSVLLKMNAVQFTLIIFFNNIPYESS